MVQLLVEYGGHSNKGHIQGCGTYSFFEGEGRLFGGWNLFQYGYIQGCGTVFGRRAGPKAPLISSIYTYLHIYNKYQTYWFLNIVFYNISCFTYRTVPFIYLFIIFFEGGGGAGEPIKARLQYIFSLYIVTYSGKVRDLPVMQQNVLLIQTLFLNLFIVLSKA